MNEMEIGGILVAIIIGVCQAFKYAGLNTRYIPLIAITLGIVGSVYTGGANWLSILAGLITSFTASGIFSGFKKTILNK